jgi:hypothetical protein
MFPPERFCAGGRRPHGSERQEGADSRRPTKRTSRSRTMPPTTGICSFVEADSQVPLPDGTLGVSERLPSMRRVLGQSTSQRAGRFRRRHSTFDEDVLGIDLPAVQVFIVVFVLLDYGPFE